MLVVPDASELRLLTYQQERWNDNGVAIGLFVSNHTPVAGDLLADYEAIEATFPGYARGNVNDWVSPVSDGAGRARTQSLNVLEFARVANGAAETAYGYFAVSIEVNELLWAELFAVPFPIDDETADPILIRPRFTLRSEPP